MASNFLGSVEEESGSRILSSAALEAREGTILAKGLNYRGSDATAVVLVLPDEDGTYRDEWDGTRGVLRYRGHDSTTVEGGDERDQLLSYAGGRLTDNGKFYKAAQELKDGVRPHPLSVQIYEKLAAGAWYDKGLFSLIDATSESPNGRLVFYFYFAPHVSTDDRERMLPASEKAAAWKAADGRCAECGAETDLYFGGAEVELRCAMHAGRESYGLL